MRMHLTRIFVFPCFLCLNLFINIFKNAEFQDDFFEIVYKCRLSQRCKPIAVKFHRIESLKLLGDLRHYETLRFVFVLWWFE